MSTTPEEALLCATTGGSVRCWGRRQGAGAIAHAPSGPGMDVCAGTLDLDLSTATIDAIQRGLYTRGMGILDAPAELRHLVQEVAALVRDEVGAQAHVFWFGSWVKGSATPRSDLDIGVLDREPLSPSVRARIAERVDDLATLRSIDVVDLASVPEELRAQVLREGLAL